MSAIMNEFWRPDEGGLAEQFLRHGYVIQDAEDRESLDRIRDLVADLVAGFLELPPPEDKGRFLDTIHERVEVERLNDLRFSVIHGMNAQSSVRPCYFGTARRAGDRARRQGHAQILHGRIVA